MVEFKSTDFESPSRKCMSSMLYYKGHYTMRINKMTFRLSEARHPCDVTQKPPVTYEADSLEEKNQMFRLLSLITNSNRANLAHAKDKGIHRLFTTEGLTF